MDSMSKIRDLKEKITELQNFLEDFINLNQANKKKIANLEDEIRNIKQNMNKYLDELEEIIDQKKRIEEAYKTQVIHLEKREKELKTELKAIEANKKKV